MINGRIFTCPACHKKTAPFPGIHATKPGLAMVRYTCDCGNTAQFTFVIRDEHIRADSFTRPISYPGVPGFRTVLRHA